MGFMKTEQEQIKAIKQIIDERVETNLGQVQGRHDNVIKTVDTVIIARDIIDAGYGDVSEYKTEIERLKNANSELVDNLVFYKDKSYKLERSVDKLKTEIEQEVKQTRIDVLNELKKKTHNYYPSIDSYCISQHVVLVRDIDELIEEVQNEKDNG